MWCTYDAWLCGHCDAGGIQPPTWMQFFNDEEDTDEGEAV